MVDSLTVEIGLLILAAISTAWAILVTIVSKRKALRQSLRNFQNQMIERLNQKNTTRRGIGFIVIFSLSVGMAIYYSVGEPISAYVIGALFFGWIVVGSLIFGNPDEVVEVELLSKSEVEKLIDDKLKEEREKSSRP